MNKHLNNWFDEVEGLEPETTNKAIKKEKERQGHIVPNSEYTVKDDKGEDVVFESYVPFKTKEEDL